MVFGINPQNKKRKLSKTSKKKVDSSDSIDEFSNVVIDKIDSPDTETEIKSYFKDELGILEPAGEEQTKETTSILEDIHNTLIDSENTNPDP